MTTDPTIERAEREELLAVVRRYGDERLVPRASEDEAASRFPRDVVGELGGLDLTGLPFPEEDGGAGQPASLALEVIEELSRAWLTVGLSLSVHHLATGVVARHASEPARSEVLPGLSSGRLLAAYALSEPQSGSDAAALTTRAERDGDEYVLNGTKSWITHAGHADVYVVMCRTGEHRTRGITALLVPADAPGLSFPPPERKMGMHASPTGQVVLDGVRVPASHRLGEEGDGFAIALQALDGGRLGIASCAIGLAQAAVDHATAYAREREQFSRPIGDFQGVRFMLADMATKVAAARALTRDAAARRDAGEPYGQLAAMAKLTATDAAMSVTTDAVQVLGGAGYTREEPVERWFREAKVLQIVEGTNQIQRLVIARGLLDTP